MITTLTLDQAAARINRSNRTVRRLIADGELGCVHVPGGRVIREDQLDAYISRNTVPAYHDPSDPRGIVLGIAGGCSMTCPSCREYLRKFLRAGVFVRVCPKSQPYQRVVTKVNVPKTTGLTGDIMAMLAAGMSQSAICLALNISNRSYRMYLTNAQRAQAMKEAA